MSDDKYDWHIDQKYGWNIRYAKPEISFIRVSPHIEDGDITHKPVVDIYWNQETKQIDVKYEGPVSDAAKVLCDQFAYRMWEYFKEQLIQEQGE